MGQSSHLLSEKFKKRAPKPTTNEDDKKSETSLDKKGDSEKEVTTLIDDDSYTHRKRRNSTPPETPPSKRMRPSVAQQASILKGVEGNDVSPNATAGHLPLQAASRLAHDTSGPLSTRKTRRAPVPTDPPVNIVSDSEKSEVELQVSPKVENKSPHTPQGDLNPQPSTSKLSPRPKIVPRVLNEDPDTPLLPSVSAASSTAPPKFGPPRGLKPKSTMPAHRVRAANTRVKMIDQPLTEQSRPINVKARLLAHMKDESGETVQATQPEIPRPGWGKKFKPGPGRSSAGLQAAYLGSRSSPHSTNDGPSKVPRKSKRIDKAKAPQQSVPEEYDQSTVVAPPGETHDQDIVMQDGEARGDDQPIEASHPISPLTNEQPSTASDVRTSDIRASSLEGKVVELPAPRIEVTTEGSSYQVYVYSVLYVHSDLQSN